jgi:hypothetical protein
VVVLVVVVVVVVLVVVVVDVVGHGVVRGRHSRTNVSRSLRGLVPCGAVAFAESRTRTTGGPRRPLDLRDGRGPSAYFSSPAIAPPITTLMSPSDTAGPPVAISLPTRPVGRGLDRSVKGPNRVHVGPAQVRRGPGYATAPR